MNFRSSSEKVSDMRLNASDLITRRGDLILCIRMGSAAHSASYTAHTYNGDKDSFIMSVY